MKPPKIDNRDFNTLLKQMEEMIPFYTPEWNFSVAEPDAGSALVMIFLNMFEGVIKRFNHVPYKNYIEFLNMVGVKLSPPQAVEVPVTFKLSEGSIDPVLVKEGTKIAAYPDGSNEPVIFETAQNMLLTPAKITALYNVNVLRDSITKLPDSLFEDPRKCERSDVRMFDASGDNLQQHIFYIAQDDIMNVSGIADFSVMLLNEGRLYERNHLKKLLSDSRYCTWQYWGEKVGVTDWFSLKASCGDNDIKLSKVGKGQIEPIEVNGESHRWLRCILDSKGLDVLNSFNINLAQIAVSRGGEDSEKKLYPEMMFYNDTLLDVQNFHPFGENFSLYDTFYLSSQEAFSKKGARITVEFNITLKEICLIQKQETERKWKLIMKKSEFQEKQVLKASISKVIWEYWNGTAWMKLPVSEGSESIFEKEGADEISFVCPEDISEFYVNNQFNYWIRARVAGIRNMYSTDFIFLSPRISEISLNYLMDGYSGITNIVTLNNMEYIGRSLEVARGKTPFPLFYTFSQNGAAIYLGFDKPPVKGPVSIFFDIDESFTVSKINHSIRWEYLREDKSTLSWKEMKVTDCTGQFTKSGTITFIGMPDFAKESLFTKELYWIRIVDMENGFEPYMEYPVVKGIYINTGWVVQGETVINGHLRRRDDSDNIEYIMERIPVINEEIWIKEEEILNDEEIKSLVNCNYEVNVVRDVLGEAEEVWVRWIRVDDFLKSGLKDRHYILDEVSGSITFGDGVNGKKPQYLSDSNTKIKYKTGGGSIGNVSAFEISLLQNAISHVDEVYNPCSASGGCDSESMEQAAIRGPWSIIHRDRAVTADDFEILAKQGNRSVTKAKCLSNINACGHKEQGCITLVISTVTGGTLNRPSKQLRNRVLDYISERASDTVISGKLFNVIEPVYVEISLVIAAVSDMNSAYQVEQDLLSKFNTFLDPFYGNFNKEGWDIGQLPHISMFYSLAGSVQNVKYVDSISVLYRIMKDNKYEEVDCNSLSAIPHLLVVNGKHSINAYAEQ